MMLMEPESNVSVLVEVTRTRSREPESVTSPPPLLDVLVPVLTECDEIHVVPEIKQIVISPEIADEALVLYNRKPAVELLDCVVALPTGRTPVET